MRIRIIKPDFYKNEQLGQCSVYARLLYPGLWMLADREGRFEDRPLRIRAEIFPYDFDVDVDALLDELATQGLVVRYEVHGRRLACIPAFLKHQSPHVRESASVLPGPDHATTVVQEDTGAALREGTRPAHAKVMPESARDHEDVTDLSGQIPEDEDIVLMQDADMDAPETDLEDACQKNLAGKGKNREGRSGTTKALPRHDLGSTKVAPRFPDKVYGDMYDIPPYSPPHDQKVCMSGGVSPSFPSPSPDKTTGEREGYTTSTSPRSRGQAGEGKTFADSDMDFHELRAFYSENIRCEGPLDGFMEYKQLRKCRDATGNPVWPGLDTLCSDLKARKDAGEWNPGYEMGLARYLKTRLWQVPVTPRVRQSSWREERSEMARMALAARRELGWGERASA